MICKEHGRELEAFCMLCKGEDEPMCSICLSLHNNLNHKVQGAHISERIRSILETIKELVGKKEDQEKQREDLSVHHAKLIEETIRIKTDIEKKNEEIQSICLSHIEESKKQNNELSQHADKTHKTLEIWKEKIKDCEEVSNELYPQIEEQLKNQEYWEAYDSVKATLKEDIALDVPAFQERLSDYETQLKLLEKELNNFNALNSSSTQEEMRLSEALEKELSEYKKMLADKEKEQDFLQNQIQTELQELKQALAAEKVKNASLQEQCEKYSEKKEQELQAQHEEEIKKLKKALAEEQKKNVKLQEQNKKLSEENKSLQKPQDETKLGQTTSIIDPKPKEPPLKKTEKKKAAPLKISPSSNIVKDEDHISLLHSWLGPKQLNLLYRGSSDGFAASTFHDKCDGKGPTITFIRSIESSHIFGGYTSESWQSPMEETQVKDESAFVFSLTKKFRSLFTNDFGVLQSSEGGPIFGNDLYGTSEICISNDCDTTESNFHPGEVFKYSIPLENLKVALEDIDTFLVAEIEVFSVSD